MESTGPPQHLETPHFMAGPATQLLQTDLYGSLAAMLASMERFSIHSMESPGQNRRLEQPYLQMQMEQEGFARPWSGMVICGWLVATALTE